MTEETYLQRVFRAVQRSLNKRGYTAELKDAGTPVLNFVPFICAFSKDFYIQVATNAPKDLIHGIEAEIQKEFEKSHSNWSVELFHKE